MAIDKPADGGSTEGAKGPVSERDGGSSGNNEESSAPTRRVAEACVARGGAGFPTDFPSWKDVRNSPGRPVHDDVTGAIAPLLTRHEPPFKPDGMLIGPDHPGFRQQNFDDIPQPGNPPNSLPPGARFSLIDPFGGSGIPDPDDGYPPQPRPPHGVRPPNFDIHSLAHGDPFGNGPGRGGGFGDGLGGGFGGGF